VRLAEEAGGVMTSSWRIGDRVRVRQSGSWESGTIIRQEGEVFTVKRDGGAGFFDFDFTWEVEMLTEAGHEASTPSLRRKE
jgi:hypothetical protein